MKKQWEMSETQKEFLELVRNSGADGITFYDAKKSIPQLKTGHTVTLCLHGYIKTDGYRAVYNIDTIYNGEIVDTKTYGSVVYKLADGNK